MRALIKTIASIEVFIGFFTLAGMAFYAHFLMLAKPLNVLVFVTLTSTISVLLGMGLFRYKKAAATLLVFFSGCIILTKVMVAAGLLKFSGEIITSVPSDTKNLISIIYHGLIILILTRPSIRDTLR